jgi:hypothetical protein
VIWLPYLVDALCEWNGEQFADRKELDENCLRKLHFALCSKRNTGVWGYELINRVNVSVRPDDVEIWNEINGKMIGYYEHRIYELLYKAAQIKQRGGTHEVLRIVRECMELVQMIKDYLPETDLKQIAEDLKMISGEWGGEG